MQTFKKGTIEYTSVNASELGDNFRMDSEYYDAKYIKLFNQINSKSLLYGRDVSSYIKKGIFDISPDLYKSDGVPFIRVKNCNNIFINEQDLVFLDKETHSENSNTELNIGDIVMSKVGTIGEISINLKFEKINFSQNNLGIKVNQGLINSFYFISYLRSNYALNLIERNQSGNVQQKLVLEDIRNLPIPIPSLEFQQKIEELIVKSYEEKEKSESLYKEAENILLQELNLLNFQPSPKEFSIFHQLFTIENNSSIIKYSDLIDADRLDAEYWDSKYLEIQDEIDGIPTEKLGELVNYKKGIEVGTGKYIEDSETEFIDDKKYFIRVSNVSKQGLSFGSPKYITKETFEELQNYKPERGEILFSKDGTAGITYLLREDVDGIISGGILRLQNKSDIQLEYIELVLNSILIQSEIEKTTNGALIQHLKIEDALNFNIPIISKEKRDEITHKTQESFIAKEKSKKLLEVAKKSVEIYIENEEGDGLRYIQENM